MLQEPQGLTKELLLLSNQENSINGFMTLKLPNVNIMMIGDMTVPQYLGDWFLDTCGYQNLRMLKSVINYIVQWALPIYGFCTHRYRGTTIIKRSYRDWGKKGKQLNGWQSRNRCFL